MTQRAERLAIGSAIAFALVYVVGFITLFAGLPNYDSNNDSLEEINRNVVDTYNDSGKRVTAIVGAYLVVVAALLFVYVVSGLRARMRRLEVSPIASDTVFGAGILASTLMCTGGLAAATIAGDIAVGSEPTFAVDVMRALPQLAFPLILIGSMLALAVVIGVLVILSLRGHVLPRWLGYAGIVGFLGAVTGILFIPQILVMLWFLALGIVAALGKLPERASATPAG